VLLSGTEYHGKIGREKKVGNKKRNVRDYIRRRSGRKERNKKIKKRFLLLFGTISFGGDLLPWR
jgi:hypothetical protein